MSRGNNHDQRSTCQRSDKPAQTYDELQRSLIGSEYQPIRGRGQLFGFAVGTTMQLHPRNSMSITLVVVRAQMRAELMATQAWLQEQVAELRKELAAARAKLRRLRAVHCAAQTQHDSDAAP
jgi:hypothetical protein